MLVMAMPNMALPVLFREISLDLDLDLVRIGSIWGFGALARAVFGLFGGALGDLHKTKWVVGCACILSGLVGGARGLSNGYAALVVTTLLGGLVGSAIPMNVHKTVSQWFSSKSLGRANSLLALGVGLGAMLGSLVSASWLSPWLGGWRHVVFFYGGISIAVGMLWLLGPGLPRPERPEASERIWPDVGSSFRAVLPLKEFWVVSLGGLFFGAAMHGMIGYLPLYLSSHGWTSLSADSALSVYHAASIIGVIPLVVLAERFRATRGLLLCGAFTLAVGLLLIAAFPGALVWPVVVIMGVFREAVVATAITATVRLAGVGPRLAGTALGISFSVSGIGRFVSPPLGNSLARFGGGYPFVLWAFLAIVSFIAFLFVKRLKEVTPGEVVSGLTEAH
jgi:MFS family permease